MKKIIIFILALFLIANIVFLNKSVFKVEAYNINENELSETEQYAINHYVKPEIDNKFEDNKIIVVLRNKLFADNNVDFNAFSDFDNIVAISDYSQTLKKGNNEKIEFGSFNNTILELTLSQHNKAEVISTIDLLMSKEYILTAEPKYNYDITK